MNRILWSKTGMAAAACLAALLAAGTSQAQQENYNPPYMYPLQPEPPNGLPVSPFFEGWYNNGDGTYTFSFGYLNRNEHPVHIPLEEQNLDPNDFQGVQPTVFQPGRHQGAFAVTVPADRRRDDVWWYITNLNGDIHRVPGRAIATAYELDWNPRPHGSLPPLVWFASRDAAERGPGGVTASQVLRTRIGQAVTLSVNTLDDSDRDPEEVRLHLQGKTTPAVRVVWSVYQGNPNGFQFSRHQSNPMPDSPEEGGFARRSYDRSGNPEPQTILLPQGRGTARVNAIFTEPGEYLFRAQVDNFAAPDSSGSDQCCWSNAYQRVVVTQ